MGKRKYDFAGWVTKNDIRCSDGVTIKHDAFRDNDGQQVPLVWNHDYNSPNNVLGHVYFIIKNKVCMATVTLMILKKQETLKN